MKINNNLTIDIVGLDDEFELAVRVIKKIILQNNYDFNLKICIDYSISDLGLYYLKDEKEKYNIYINPDRCDKLEDCYDGYPGYINDDTKFGVIMHEFVHFLTKIEIKDFEKIYLNNFSNERLTFSNFSNSDVYEEIAEIGYLYITNPYLLSLISKKHYKFFKSVFKSPCPMSKKRSIELYLRFPEHCKNILKAKYGITYNVEKNILERI